MAELLAGFPEPLPSPEALPSVLEGAGAWYPAFRQALEQHQRQHRELFAGSLRHWLGPDLPVTDAQQQATR